MDWVTGKSRQRKILDMGRQCKHYEVFARAWVSYHVVAKLEYLADFRRSGTALSKAPSVKDNFVVYIVNPYPHGPAYADICSAFLQLFNKFVKDLDQQQPRSEINELVLQILPISFISSPCSMIVPSQADYLNLALEVYNRCTPPDPASSVLGCAPPVLLAEPIPKSINFRLAPERSSPFSEGRTLHLAFSRSLDQRWITAAWSDNLGSFQISLSYCLRVKGSVASRTLLEIRQEIWDTTKDILERFQTKWKTVLVRTEPVEPEEIECTAEFLPILFVLFIYPLKERKLEIYVYRFRSMWLTRNSLDECCRAIQPSEIYAGGINNSERECDSRVRSRTP
jgi:hypothetical protein